MEENISLEKFETFQSEIIKKSEYPKASISCDMVMEIYHSNIYAIEFGVNLNMSESSTSGLWHHVYKQAEFYHHGLNAKETWVINWTTVKPSKISYWFPKSNVKTMHVYYNENFMEFMIFVEENGKEISYDVKKKFDFQIEKKFDELKIYEKGFENGKLEMAINLIENGINMDMIIVASGFSKEKVKELYLKHSKLSKEKIENLFQK
jgi:hypothetical protein